MVTYYRPSGQTTARSSALASWGKGIMVAGSQTETVYQFDGSNLAQVFENGQAGGFVDVATDPAGNAWVLTYAGRVFKVSPTGAILATFDLTIFFPGQLIPFTGVTIANGNPYFLLSNGTVYTIAGGVAVQVGALMGTDGENTVGFSSFGSNIYAVLPSSQRLSTLALSGTVNGTVTKVTTPMLVPASTAASASGVAVVGWNDAALVSGATALAMSPAGAFTAAIASSANAVMLLSGTDPNWQLIGSVAAQGAPTDLSWASSGEQVIVTDTAHSEVSIYNLIGSTLTFSANIATTGANHVGVTPDGLTALVTRTTQNAIRVLTNTANVWSTHNDITVTNKPGPIVVLSETEAVAGYVPLSGIGGLVWLALVNGTWGIETAVTGLSFPVSGVCVDSSGTVYAVGTTGVGASAHGNLAAVTKAGGIIATTSWAGGADAVLWDQGQIAVIDTGS